jgi:hypothetical protein
MALLIEQVSNNLQELERTIQVALQMVQHRERQLEAQELELVKAAESLTVTARIRQAEQLGRDLERQRVVALIDVQLEMLQRGGLNALSLEHLRRQVVEVEG